MRLTDIVTLIWGLWMWAAVILGFLGYYRPAIRFEHDLRDARPSWRVARAALIILVAGGLFDVVAQAWVHAGGAVASGLLLTATLGYLAYTFESLHRSRVRGEAKASSI